MCWGRAGGQDVGSQGKQNRDLLNEHHISGLLPLAAIYMAKQVCKHRITEIIHYKMKGLDPCLNVPAGYYKDLVCKIHH